VRLRGVRDRARVRPAAAHERGAPHGRRDGASQDGQREPRADARERLAAAPRSGSGTSVGARQGADAPPADAPRGGRAAHSLHHGAAARHRRDARGARRDALRDPRSPPCPRSRPGGDRPELPRQADDPRRGPARAGRGRRGAHRGDRPPDPRPRGPRAGTAPPPARRPCAPPGRGPERLGRHLAAPPRLRESRGAVAPRRRARRHLPRRGLHPARAAGDLSRVHRPPGLPRAGTARPRAGARSGRRIGADRGQRHRRTPMSWPEPWDTIEAVALTDEPVSRARAAASPAVRSILERALERRELTAEEGETLLEVGDADLRALVRTADTVRAADVGDEVTYVVNRNINFTNVCFVNCQFCAFKRQRWEADAYTHGLDLVLGKVEEAIQRGATEVCMQGGINPDMDAFAYRDILTAIKTRYPALHVHAFSPMEIMYGTRRTRMSYPAYIGMLRDAGLGSIPGTAAEILDDEVREILSHKKVDVRTWVEIITTAHALGVPTTSTVMYG